MPKNSRVLIWIELVLMAVVMLFGIWGVIHAQWILLILVVVPLVLMVRQWRVLQSMNADEYDDDDEGEGEDEDDEE